MKYNSDIFPGLYVKFDIGTAILFHSGDQLFRPNYNESYFENEVKHIKYYEAENEIRELLNKINITK
jgi:hypothetical protein